MSQRRGLAIEGDLPVMFTVEQLAERWGVNPKTVYTAIAAKQIHVLRLGRIIRISRSVVERMENEGALPDGR